MRPVMPALFTSPVTVPNRSIAAGTTAGGGFEVGEVDAQQQHARAGFLARPHDHGRRPTRGRGT